MKQEKQDYLTMYIEQVHAWATFQDPKIVDECPDEPQGLFGKHNEKYYEQNLLERKKLTIPYTSPRA